ncbi:MAG: LptF/LptG family permease [Rickettsiaceae bacterium]|nr:MAG: LptF/LptG family permease [Rickettsiaceae bacterium]
MIYRTYIIKSIILPFLFAIFLVIGVSWVTQVFKLLYLIDKGISIINFIQLTTLILPLLLFIAAPLVTVIAVLYVYNRLMQEKQIIILKNLGLSNIVIASPALIFTLYITAISYYISIEGLPNSYLKLKTNLSFAKNNITSSFIKEKAFNKLSRNINIYVDAKSADGSMQEIVIFDRRIEEKPVLIIAKKGNFKKKEEIITLELFDGLRQVYDLNANLTELHFNFLSIQINDTKYNSKHSIKRDANEYYIQELLKLKVNDNKGLIAQGHQRIIWPLYSFVLTFVALALLLEYMSDRKSKIIIIIKISFILALITSIHFTILNYATKNIEAIWGCYFNIIFTIFTGIYLYNRKVL